MRFRIGQTISCAVLPVTVGTTPQHFGRSYALLYLLLNPPAMHLHVSMLAGVLLSIVVALYLLLIL